jgi:hypothetical protein
MLPQPGNVSLCLGITRESLMRSLFRAFGGVAEFRRRTSNDAPPANDIAAVIWGPPAKPRPIEAAMSWLLQCLIEGMAAYGEAMCPCIADLPDRQAEHDKQAGSLVPWPPAGRSRQGSVSASFDPGSLDDRIRRDIGLPPHQADEFVRQMDTRT